MDEAAAMRAIIASCLTLDRLAVGLYEAFARKTPNPILKSFWQDMAADERRHVQRWEQLRSWSEEQPLPAVFDEPEQVRAELEAVEHKCRQLLETQQDIEGNALMFLLAFKFEFYLLHPAFETLLGLSRSLGDREDLEDEYQRHISKLFDALAENDLASMELQLLGETIRRIWEGNRRMARLATVDPLTGVLNRRGLFNTILPLAHLAQRNAMNVAVFMVDVDDFKKVNDRLGHQEGDRVLRHVGEALRGAVRTSDVVGRYGGEEFLVFVASATPAGAQGLGVKLLDAVRSGNRDHAGVTVSIGVAVGRLGRNVSEEVEGLIRAADRNLLRAKEQGKDRMVSGLEREHGEHAT